MGRNVLSLISRRETAEKGICFMRVIFVLDIYCQFLKFMPSALYMMVVENDKFSCEKNRFSM
jgi:hypothetical protein